MHNDGTSRRKILKTISGGAGATVFGIRRVKGSKINQNDKSGAEPELEVDVTVEKVDLDKNSDIVSSIENKFGVKNIHNETCDPCHCDNPIPPSCVGD